MSRIVFPVNEPASRRPKGGAGPVAVRPRGERTERKAEKIAFGVGMIALLYAVWEIVTAMRIEPAILLPGPADVGAAFKTVFSNSAIWTDLRVSGEEFLYGYVLAAVVGVVGGVLIGWYARVGYMLDPLVNFMYAVPRVALTPLLIIWLGIGLTSKIALVFLIAVFPVLINTSSGVRNLDPQLLRTARCFGAGDLQIFRTVALPASVPFILSGLRLAVGQGIIGVFVAELVGAENGVGQMMNNAGEQYQTATVFVGLIIFAAAGVLFTGAVRAVERHFDAWRA